MIKRGRGRPRKVVKPKQHPDRAIHLEYGLGPRKKKGWSQRVACELPHRFTLGNNTYKRIRREEFSIKDKMHVWYIYELSAGGYEAFEAWLCGTMEVVPSPNDRVGYWTLEDAQARVDAEIKK